MKNIFNFLKSKGFVVRQCNEWHIQIKHRSFTFNIYPTKNRVYINGMTKGFNYFGNDDLLKILEMEGSLESNKSIKIAKRRTYRHQKVSLFLKSNICWICRQNIGNVDEASIDHAIPLAKGGSNRMDNLRLAHVACNHKKGDSLKFEF